MHTTYFRLISFFFCSLLIFLSSCAAPAKKPDSPVSGAFARARPTPQRPKKAPLPAKSANKNDQPSTCWVLLDPGHGGEDFGTSSSNKRDLEKIYALKTSLLVKKELERYGIKVRLTRQRDRFLTLSQRVALAKEHKPLCFISIHYNSAPNRLAEGMEIFYPMTSKTYFQRSAASKALAQKVLDGVQSSGYPIRSVKNANFYVLRNTPMPAILIEVGFMSNTVEMIRLRRNTTQELIARAIATGIAQWLEAPEK